MTASIPWVPAEPRDALVARRQASEREEEEEEMVHSPAAQWSVKLPWNGFKESREGRILQSRRLTE